MSVLVFRFARFPVIARRASSGESSTLSTITSQVYRPHIGTDIASVRQLSAGVARREDDGSNVGEGSGGLSDSRTQFGLGFTIF
jgi:hypothetical protein